MTITAGTAVRGSATTQLDLGPARALSCRECGHEVPLAAEFACTECFGPLDEELLLAEDELERGRAHAPIVDQPTDSP